MAFTMGTILLGLATAAALINLLIGPTFTLASSTPTDQTEDILHPPDGVADQFVQHNRILMSEWRPKIKTLCRNRKLQLPSVTRMLQLIEAINQELRCAEHYQAAIYEIYPILMRRKERLCNGDTFEMIKHYHFRFIQPHKRSFGLPTGQAFKGQLHPEPRTYFSNYDEHDQILSTLISVRHFWLKFALQLSHQCKMDLIRNLVEDQERILESGDLELMAPFTEALLGRGEQMGAESPSGIDFDNVLYIPELDGPMRRVSGELYEPTGGGAKQRQLRTTADEGSDLYRMIIACKSRFKPMYDQLIMPIVRLSKLGYDYQGPKGWTEAERGFLDSDLVRDWLVIVHVCESIKNTHLLRIRPKSRTLADILMSRDELEEEDAEESRPFVLTQSEIDASQEDQLLDDNVEPADYSPSGRYLMADELLVVGERELDQELARKFGKRKEGAVEAFLRRLVNYPKRALAVVDLMRVAHYRRNLSWYSGIIKFLTNGLGLVGLGLTLQSLIAGG